MVSITSKWHSRQNAENCRTDVQLRTSLCYEKQRSDGLFGCFQGLKQEYVVSPVRFSLFINELANKIIGKAKHGLSLGPTEIELFILLFADDFTCLHCNRASESIECAVCSCKKIRSDC